MAQEGGWLDYLKKFHEYRDIMNPINTPIIDPEWTHDNEPWYWGTDWLDDRWWDGPSNPSFGQWFLEWWGAESLPFPTENPTWIVPWPERQRWLNEPDPPKPRPYKPRPVDPRDPRFRHPFPPTYQPYPDPHPWGGPEPQPVPPDYMAQQDGGASIDPMTPKSAARDWAAPPQPAASSPKPMKKRSSGGTKGPSKGASRSGGARLRSSGRASKGKK